MYGVAMSVKMELHKVLKGVCCCFLKTQPYVATQIVISDRSKLNSLLPAYW